MIRLGLGVALVLMLGLATVSRAGAATRPVDELRPLIVGPEDLGAGWFTMGQDQEDTNPPSILRSLQRNAPLTFVLVDLRSESALNPDISADTLLSDFAQVFPAVRRGDRFMPAGYPSGAVAYALAGNISGSSAVGAIVSWQLQDVLATEMVLTLTSGRSSQVVSAEVARLADVQRDKLASRLGSPPPAAQTSLPVNQGLIDCSSFTHQEAAQLVLASYQGDPYRLDVDGNGLACEDLPARSDAPVEPVRSQPAPAPSPSPPPAPPERLFQASGSGDAETDFFTVNGRVEICFEVSGRSPSGNFGPDAGFFIRNADGSTTGTSFSSVQSNRCTFANLRPGRYYFRVIATSWTSWRITVRPA